MTLYTLNSAGCQLDKTREKKNMIYLRTLTGASPEKTVCVCVCVSQLLAKALDSMIQMEPLESHWGCGSTFNAPTSLP